MALNGSHTGVVRMGAGATLFMSLAGDSAIGPSATANLNLWRTNRTCLLYQLIAYYARIILMPCCHLSQLYFSDRLRHSRNSVASKCLATNPSLWMVFTSRVFRQAWNFFNRSSTVHSKACVKMTQ